jgi:feruloyl-CoA synthase
MSSFLAPLTIVTRLPSGVLHARSPEPLGPYPARLTERLERWAHDAPDRTFLAERDDSGAWRRLTYAEALSQVRRVAQAFISRGLSADRPVIVLSGHGIEHAVIGFAAMYAGVPHAPIAPAYSLVSRDFGALRAIWAQLRPGLVFAAEGAPFESALASLPDREVEVVTLRPLTSQRRVTSFEELIATTPTPAVDEAHRRVGPSTVAKILFTSGSTGAPKGVVNTQRMLCANQEQLRMVMPFLSAAPPVLCDWLPWNHTFGGNHNLGIALYNGGTLYIDAGSPAPGRFEQTIANLREVATTAYFNVPKGYEMLLPVLQTDASFRERFFSRLEMLFYAAAALRQDVSDAITALAEACGRTVPWVSGLGATETAPFALCTGAMPAPVAGRIGVPAPGVDMRVVPVGDRWEARVRGPNVTPGYWGDEALTAAAFDEEGYYRMGDAVGLVDPAHPERGFTFEGRLNEDFKLSTGTWVRVGPLRSALLSGFGDLVQDVVVTGHGRDELGALVFPAVAACAALCGSAGVSTAARHDVLSHPAVGQAFADRLARFAAAHPASSTCIRRMLLLDEPPSLDGGEITDKGTINQRAVLTRRAGLVQRLYDSTADPRRIDLSGKDQTA